MKLPSAYTNLRGAHQVRADQSYTRDFVKTEEPAVDLEKDNGLVKNLDYELWLPYAAKTYHISPHIESYVVIPTPICPAILPNRNGIAFPLNELTKYQPPPVARMAYKAWTGCPMHLEHDNEDCTKAYGVVLDSVLTPIKGYGGGKYWKVMGLAAIDKDKHPEIAQKLLDKEIDTFSMGALADYFTCSVCGQQVFNEKNRYRNCKHVAHSETVNFNMVNHQGQNKLAFLNAHNLSPIELSVVEDPAWTTALSDQILLAGH